MIIQLQLAAPLQNLLHDGVGRLPDVGFSEADIESLLLQISSFDSNNWENSVGVGEREGRVLVNFIRRRHYGFTHGIGRSGDIAAIQPKASGSSLICRLTNQLLLDWLRKSGSPSTSACFLVPMATGMSLTLCLLAMKRRRPRRANFVLWSRIDQKSCFKCMLAAGLIPIPIELVTDTSNDQLCSNLDALEIALKNPAKYLLDHWPDAAQAYNVDDKSIENSTSDDIPSTTNHFYIDYFLDSCNQPIDLLYVQSTDKNLMVPVGGAVIAGFSTDLVDFPSTTNHFYIDYFLDSCNQPIDLLYVQSTDKNLMVPVGGAVIAGFSTDLVDFKFEKNNMIEDNQKREIFHQLTQIGANLFTQGCSGVSSTSIRPYINAASSIGQNEYEIDIFIKKLDKILQYFQYYIINNYNIDLMNTVTTMTTIKDDDDDDNDEIDQDNDVLSKESFKLNSRFI
ncbi:O-phospho-L-seryl-tRNASec:L-selenocysteinyl-tRNA synthase [Schistosoma bovis]|uniref:O-phosphoseryl-tRNA(Sec) selenium transferase n=1 Tax=Schistosoma bovis TaxID=6184 RepID=A0A430QDV9_SCHBO|nr:O-phospho-L-seryl-tRNASec:L-selenocysteinyl-tRNA synthase [Schistosoma bovis]